MGSLAVGSGGPESTWEALSLMLLPSKSEMIDSDLDREISIGSVGRTVSKLMIDRAVVVVAAPTLCDNIDILSCLE